MRIPPNDMRAINMLSINPFLQTPRDRRIDSLNRIISVLLQGISLHSFCYDEVEFGRFQRSLRKLRVEVELVDDDDSAMILAGSAIRTLEEHSAALEKTIASRQNDLEAAMALLSDSLLTVSSVGETLALELKESERDIALARQPGDAVVARERLTRCLEDIRIRVLRRNDAAPLSSQTYAENEIDAVTGLPDSRKAVDAIVAAWDRRDEYLAAVFAVRRLDAINTRFGFQAGDEVLRAISDQLATVFARNHVLFRWRGPYLVALIDRKSAESRVTPELQRLASTRLQHTLAMKDREVLLSVSLVWALVPLQAKSIDDMVRSLDELTTIRLRHET